MGGEIKDYFNVLVYYLFIHMRSLANEIFILNILQFSV